MQSNDPTTWAMNPNSRTSDGMSPDATVSSAINPAGVDFQPISQDLAKIRLIANGIPCLILVIGFTVCAILFDPLLYIGTALSVALLVWLLWLIPRQVRAMMYAVTETDFMIRRGILFRSLTVVPFGRIQYADLSEGPIARYFGISTIKLHTASAGTDASLEGVPKTEAARLRDLFSTNGAAHMQGI